MKAIVGKRYKHYKNGKEYTVLGIGHHTETLESLVIYQAEYNTEDFGKKPIWARPKEMWEGTEKWKSSVVDRFTAID